MSSVQRIFTKLSLGEKVSVTEYVATKVYLSSVVVVVDFWRTKESNEEYAVDDLRKILLQTLDNQFLTRGQSFVVEVYGVNLKFTVKSTLEVIVEGNSNRGFVNENTVFVFEKSESTIRIVGQDDKQFLVKLDWDFNKMGIGGLDEEFSNIFRRAFASRVFPTNVINKLGINHVKGILLYGPPGTGKTLMARQIGKMLNGKTPKIVNGPEILNKYLGESERAIRDLFQDAETEYRARGDSSDLHIIIFDEIDAICKQRGTRNDNAGDTVVNQLLSKLDGVEELNNILVIGMTNRKDLIDEALLRAGRLGVHMEINLPDQRGRFQILNIHTEKMRQSKSLSSDVDLEWLAKQTINFSGAEIQDLVKNASSWALQRLVDVSSGLKVKDGDVEICAADFERALKEVKPLFGSDEFENYTRNGIIKYGPCVEKLINTGLTFIEQVRNSHRTPLVSVLLRGESGSGKTALAAYLGKQSGFPYLKMISPEFFIGLNETAKCSKIAKIFQDAYKSPLSCIVIDDIERLLDYVPIGPRFSNSVLQTLLVLLKREPPHGRKLFVLGTTSSGNVLNSLGFKQSFNHEAVVPQVESLDEIQKVLEYLQFPPDKALIEKLSKPISVKKIISMTEMWRHSTCDEN